MKAFIKKLVLDRQMVTDIRKANLDKDHLYALVFTGKITLQEYILASRGLH
ncbi:MAG: hypothetical protein ABIQ88_13220 [Chitinophagaceae bacterium]